MRFTPADLMWIVVVGGVPYLAREAFQRSKRAAISCCVTGAQVIVDWAGAPIGPNVTAAPIAQAATANLVIFFMD